MSHLRRFYDVLNDGGGIKSLQEEFAGEEGQGADCKDVGLATEARKTFETGHDVPADVWDGTATGSTASLDRNARVLPYAADSVVLEHYRRLRTKLLQEREARHFRTLMVASPNPAEGKTVTAINLALSFSMLPSWKVLIIDGDIRKGSMGKWLQNDCGRGMSDLIAGTATLNQVICKSDHLPMHFMLRGESDAAAAELLNSSRVKTYFEEISKHYDMVVVDSPPLNLVADAQLLASCCDAVLVVARAFSTTQKSLAKALQDLQSTRIVGAVLNGGVPANRYHKYKDYY